MSRTDCWRPRTSTALAAGDLDDAVARVLARLGIDDEPLRDAVTTLARGLGR